MGTAVWRVTIKHKNELFFWLVGFCPEKNVTTNAARGMYSPAGARQVARLSRIGARLMYGPIRDPPTSPRALRGPVGLGVDSQDLATILDPFRVVFADLGPDHLSAT